MKRVLYHLSGASLLVFVWRTLLWLFAWPLALYGHVRRRHKQEHREIVEALQSSHPTIASPAAPDFAALADQKEREAQEATGFIQKVLQLQAAGLRKRA